MYNFIVLWRGRAFGKVRPSAEERIVLSQPVSVLQKARYNNGKLRNERTNESRVPVLMLRGTVPGLAQVITGFVDATKPCKKFFRFKENSVARWCVKIQLFRGMSVFCIRVFMSCEFCEVISICDRFLYDDF